MPKYKRKRKPAFNKKRVNRKVGRKVKSHPTQIQNASYLPKSRLIKFTDFRSYIVTDDGFNAGGALPPVLEIGANNPRKFVHGSQGTWDDASLGAKTQAVPGIAAWVTNSVPTPTATAPYLNASALSARVTITAVPIPTASTTPGEVDYHQDVIKLCVQNNTRNGMFFGKNITNAFNSEIISQTPYVRTANMYYNANGTPRGATISINYSFKKQNAGRPMLNSANFFASDADPLEKDYINVALLPTHSQKYGLTALGGVRLPNVRLEVKISYIVLLSEPNGKVGIATALNAGNNLVDMPTAANLTPDQSQ
ncbi:MAG: hypothetical protein [Circular genetic element sp.]|nr:MAG: hypothetical protein [Circular genetic element sp.]